MRIIRELAFHQTDTPTASLEAVRRYHTEILGWSDIGYHFLLQPDGRIEAGRPVEKVGAHVKDANANSIGICSVGRGKAFPIDRGGYMTLAMWHSLLRLTLQLLKQYGIPADALKGHREYPSGAAQKKSCPGWNLAWLRTLMRGPG